MHQRAKARETALQILYQTEFENFEEAAVDYTLNEFSIVDETKNFALFIINGVRANIIEIDKYIEKTLINWRIERISLIDKTLLRMGIFEIAIMNDITKNVTISEIIKLAKNYSEPESYKFINGILDKFEKTGDIKTTLKK